jgi:hypothetical protein
MKSSRLLRPLSIALTPILLAASVATGFGPNGAGASSHREAPLIAKDPSADVTDVYAFRSPDDPDTVTLISNWIPFQEPGGGPNFYHFDENARYNIKVDRDGDGVPEYTYTWTFSKPTPKNSVLGRPSFLYNDGQLTERNDANLLLSQTYSVTEYIGDTDSPTSTVLFADVQMVPDHVGARSTPDYESLAELYVNEGEGDAEGIKEFTGQRDDPFYVDVNSIFDLGGLRPFNNLHLIPLPVSGGLDSTAGYNIHTTAIQLPIERIAPDCDLATAGVLDDFDANCVIGVWSTADRPAVTTRALGSETAGSDEYVQVSRLGMPLTNEVVLPIVLKDAFNGLKPEDDTTLFAGGFDAAFGAPVGQIAVSSVLTPELQLLLPVLYPGVFVQSGTGKNLPDFPRSDLLTIFLTGVPGVNAQANSGNPFEDPTKTASDQLRLNLAVAPTADVCEGEKLGVLVGDLAGFPNGRRLEDDITDVALRAVAGGYGEVLEDLLGLPNFSPGNLLNDGVNANDKPCLDAFPYVGTPHSGYDRIHAAIRTVSLPVVRNYVQPQ